MTEEQFILQNLIDKQNCLGICDYLPKPISRLDSYSRIEKLVNTLPGFSYVREQYANFLFSTGLVCDNSDDDDKLTNFLNQKNGTEVPNEFVLRNATTEAKVYGECGVRFNEADKNLYLYKQHEFGTITINDNGIEWIAGFIINKHKHSINSHKFDNLESYEQFYNFLDKNELIYLTKDDFCLMRNRTEFLHGKSPLLEDVSRNELYSETYDRLLYDLRYDGPGRIIIHANSSETNDVEKSLASAIDNSIAGREKRVATFKDETQRIASELKHSNSSDVFGLSSNFSDKVTHLPRVTKSTEYFDWLKNGGEIVCQIFGISPSLLELGDYAGNVSMEKILDMAILNSIIPERKRNAKQFSPLIEKHLGVSKVRFNDDKLKQTENENEQRKKLAEVARQLALAYKSSDSQCNELLEPIRNIGKMIDISLHNKDNIKELKGVM